MLKQQIDIAIEKLVRVIASKLVEKPKSEAFQVLPEYFFRFFRGEGVRPFPCGREAQNFLAAFCRRHAQSFLSAFDPASRLCRCPCHENPYKKCLRKTLLFDDISQYGMLPASRREANKKAGIRVKYASPLVR